MEFPRKVWSDRTRYVGKKVVNAGKYAWKARKIGLQGCALDGAWSAAKGAANGDSAGKGRSAATGCAEGATLGIAGKRIFGE